MIFLFHSFNHNAVGTRSLEDPIGIIGHQLRALGHTAIWDPKNVLGPGGEAKNIKFAIGPGQYNVMVEGFTPDMIPLLKNRREAGCRFLCVATEEPTPQGFNHGQQKEMIERQAIFPEAMRYFDGILHLLPGEAGNRWYSQFAPAAHCELGYAPTLVERETNLNPPFDFGFFGSLSPRRYKLLDELAKRTGKRQAIKICATFPDQATRNRTMQEAKVILQVRRDDKMGLVSSSRCNTALRRGRPGVAEPHDEALSHPWDEVVKFTRSKEEFMNTAMVTVAAWRGVHAGQFARFKEKLTPEYCIGRALREIGVVA